MLTLLAVVASVAILAGAAALTAPWTIYVLLLRMLGRAPGCPTLALLSLERRLRKRDRLTQEVLAQSRCEERDGANGLCLWSTPAGSFWMPDRPESGGALADMISEQSFNQYGGPDKGVRCGDTVIDCGANVGVFTRYALEAGASLVLALEPSPATAVCLRRNLSAEIEAGRVLIFDGGAWSSDAVLAMYFGDSPSGDSVLETNGKDRRRGAAVRLAPIDQIAERFHLEKVDFIKMDIEGAEREALQGAMGVISRFQPRLAISAYHLPDDPVCLRRLIEGAQAPYRCTVESFVLHFRGYLHSRVSPEVYFFEPLGKPQPDSTKAALADTLG
jgi:FkbM family methyltransferase